MNIKVQEPSKTWRNRVCNAFAPHADPNYHIGSTSVWLSITPRDFENLLVRNLPRQDSRVAQISRGIIPMQIGNALVFLVGVISASSV
jgi:hypothetical protein